MYLQTHGHAVLCAGSAAEALEVLPCAQADVLLCDLSLPDGDGWELLPRLQALLPQPIYAIALSGHGCTSDHQASQKAGFRHHLSKPFDPRHLAALLADVPR